MVEIERRSFTSAQSAFAELSADTVPFAHLAREKLKQLGTVLSTEASIGRGKLVGFVVGAYENPHAPPKRARKV